jgi:WD40 repeat protein
MLAPPAVTTVALLCTLHGRRAFTYVLFETAWMCVRSFASVNSCSTDRSTLWLIAPQVHGSLRFASNRHRVAAFSVQLSSDSKLVLAGTNMPSTVLCDVTQNRVTAEVHGHTDDVNATVFADDSSQVFLTGSDDALIRVWDRRTVDFTARAAPVGTFLGHSSGIAFIDSRGDGRYFLSNGKDQTARLWDIRRMAPASTVSPDNISQHDYRFVPLRPGQSGVIRGDVSLQTYRGHRVMETLIRCRFSPLASTGGAYVYSGSACGHTFGACAWTVSTRYSCRSAQCMRHAAENSWT